MLLIVIRSIEKVMGFIGGWEVNKFCLGFWIWFILKYLYREF